jgi:formate dehydrogenase subunit gamma
MILAHIYMGTIGMNGAFEAMGSDSVDENWAKQHHSLWYEEQVAHGAAAQSQRPAPITAAE